MNSRHCAWAVVWAALLVHPVAVQSQWPTKAWPSSTPSTLGLDPKVIAAFDADIAAGKYGYVDSMLVIRHGQVDRRQLLLPVVLPRFRMLPDCLIEFVLSFASTDFASDALFRTGFVRPAGARRPSREHRTLG